MTPVLEAAGPTRITCKSKPTPGGFGVTNEGFRGMGVEQGKEYLFSVLARNAGDTPAALRVEVEDADGKKLGEAG